MQPQIIVGGTMPPRVRQWNNGLCDFCGSPGGCGTCCYVCCCPCCAAGDIATAAGRDYCMTCCVIPYFLGFCMPCWMTYDREALVRRYGILDDADFIVNLIKFLFCPCCMLCQELNHIKQVALEPKVTEVIVQQPAQQVMMMVPAQQPMMMVPAQQQPMTY